MPELPVQANANNARKFTIPADRGQTALDVVLPKNKQPGKYKVVKKDVPTEAQGKKFKGKKVKWINNFGVRLLGKHKTKKGKDETDPYFEEVDGETFSYNVVVPGPAPSGYDSLVYFDGSNPVDAGAKVDNDGNFKFSLSIGDPAVGWGG